MNKERNITMISGNILPSKNKTNLSKQDLDSIKGVFSSSVDGLKKAQNIVDSGDHTEQRGKYKDPNIHEDWQTVKTSSKLEIKNLNDTKTITPSRGKGETSEGGRGHLRGSIASIFNPTAVEDVRNSEYTDHAIQAGRDRKDKIAEKAAKGRDWEEITAAKNTRDFKPMGFSPLKSAFSQVPIPEVKISEVEAMKLDNNKNIEIGKEALKIREQCNKEAKKEYEEKIADNRKWEDVVLENITKANSREMSVVESSIKISSDLVKEPTKKPNLSFEGLFPVPQNPKEMDKEDSIKRDSSNLQASRTKREDDRSWETVNNAKSRKY